MNDLPGRGDVNPYGIPMPNPHEREGPIIEACVICGVFHDPKEVCGHVEDVPIPHPRAYDRRWREMDEAPPEGR